MKQRRFIQNAILLTVITFLLRGIGTVFFIFVSNKIGAEGIGLYQLTTSVYLFAITVATSGITIAVTRVVSEQYALKNTYAVRTALYTCLVLSLVMGLVSSAILFFGAGFIGNVLLRDERTILALKLLSVGLPFLSTASVLRGYFLGLQKPVMSAAGDIIEEVSMVLVTIPLLMFTIDRGLKASCCAVVIGSVVSEVISCVYSFVMYFKDKETVSGKRIKLTGQIFSIVLPIAISNYIRSLLTATENILVPIGLQKYGANNSNSLSQYGMIKGMAMSILLFPSAVLSAFASLLIPEVSGANAIMKKSRIDFIINKCFKATLLFAFLVTGVFFCFSRELGRILYQSETVGNILLVLTPLIPLLYLDQIVDSILKGLNQQLSSMKYNTVDSIIRILIIYFFVPLIGIKGYVVMLYVGTVFNASLSINRLIVVSKVKVNLVDWVLLPLVCITVSCIISKIIARSSVIIGSLLILLIYTGLLILFGCISKRDMIFVKKIFRNPCN